MTSTDTFDKIKPKIQAFFAEGGTFDEINNVFNLLLSNRPARGYFPEPTKSILVVKPALVERARDRFTHYGFKVVTDTRYLGGYIGDQVDEYQYVCA